MTHEIKLKPLCERAYERRLIVYQFNKAIANIILTIGGGLFVLGVGTAIFTANDAFKNNEIFYISLFLVMGAICVLTYVVMATFLREPRYGYQSVNCSCQLCRGTDIRDCGNRPVH